MVTKVLRWSAALAGVLALAGFVPHAQAQVINPNFRLPFSYGAYGGGGGILMNGPTYPAPSVSYLYSPGSYPNPPVPSYNPAAGTATLSTNSVGVGWGNVTPGYDPYYSDPYLPNYSPAGGYLRGKADLVASYGNFMMSSQRARLVQEEANRSQIDTRRRIWEEAQWEHMHTVFTEDYRESLIRNELRRARLEPPLNEIWSGRTLNVLLEAAAASHAKKIAGPPVTIADDVLKHINLTTGANGNIGLFKSELQWPLPLQGPDYAKMVKNLNQWIPEAVGQAKLNNKVETGIYNDILQNVQQMHETLLKNVGEMPPSDYIESKRFLNMLSDAVKALKDPNAQNFLTGKYAAKGKTVAELVDNLTRVQGLQFAPASPGDEAAYRVLYRAFQAYDAGINQLATAVPTPSSGSGDK
jgi:hypothetical protein